MVVVAKIGVVGQKSRTQMGKDPRWGRNPKERMFEEEKTLK